MPGPRQAPSYVTSSLAQQIAAIEAGLREPVLRVGNLEARRDITDVRDTVRAYRLAARARRRRAGRTTSARGRAYRVADLLDELLALSQASITVERDPARLRRERQSAHPGRLRGVSRARPGWQPRVPMRDTLRDLLDYWRRRTLSAGQACP